MKNETAERILACLDYYLQNHTNDYSEKSHTAMMMAIDALSESKTGHWIDTGSGQECSECHEIQYGYDSFRFYCAKCGSKNVEVSDD